MALALVAGCCLGTAGAEATPRSYAVPSPPRVAPLQVRIAGPQHPVAAGSRQVITLSSARGARCAVAVSYADGTTDPAASLQRVTAMTQSTTTWRWTVPRTARPGRGVIAAGCWQGTQTVTTTASFTVR